MERTVRQRRGSLAFNSRAQRIAMIGAALLGALSLVTAVAQTPGATPSTGAPVQPVAASPDLELTDASVRYLPDLDLLVFALDVAGTAGATVPAPVGGLDGAPVLGYVVPTTLPPAAVGFAAEEGIVSLAVTAHPDFDDTPLWDETLDGDFANDGGLWHTHWVLVGPDERVPGGLAVLGVAEADAADVLPPTAPGLPLYLDSPGFPVKMAEGAVQVVVPAPHVAGETEFGFDAATVYLQVNTSDAELPMLGVYDVYGVLSGDLSLPFEVESE